MRQVKSVIFDYGGVLCKLPAASQIQRFAAACGLAEADFLKHFWNFRLAYDRGDLDDAMYWKSIAKASGVNFTGDQISGFIEMDVQLWLTLDKPMLAWNRTLRSRGIKTAVLSNMPEALGAHLQQYTRIFAEFDNVTLSYEVRSAKPEAKIYRTCLAQLGIKAGDAVFLDDKSLNVHAAQAVGLHAITYKSRKELAGRELQYGLPAVNLEA